MQLYRLMHLQSCTIKQPKLGRDKTNVWVGYSVTPRGLGGKKLYLFLHNLGTSVVFFTPKPLGAL